MERTGKVTEIIKREIKYRVPLQDIYEVIIGVGYDSSNVKTIVKMEGKETELFTNDFEFSFTVIEEEIKGVKEIE